MPRTDRQSRLDIRCPWDIGRARHRWAMAHLSDLPEQYRNRLPFTEDIEKLSQAAVEIRRQFEASKSGDLTKKERTDQDD